MKQITFDFFTEEDEFDPNSFIIYTENIKAFYYLNQEEEFNNNVFNQFIFLSGERKSGKTFLANIWKQKHNAKFLIYKDFFNLPFEDFVLYVNEKIENYDYYIMDNFEKIFEEEKLFYLLNSLQQHSSKLLIVSNFIFSKIKINLKDLKSRINGAIFLRIKKFSKEIKPMLIIKIFSNRQQRISGQVLKFLVQKLPNNYEEIYDTIHEIIKTRENESSKITLQFIKEYFRDKKIY